jgi:hypothetical protein
MATRKERHMHGPRKGILLITTVVLAAAATAGPASPASDNAGCVGQFSTFFAGQGLRDDVAQDFAHNARPAGQNVYSHVAQFHGSLEECFEQT